MHKIDQVQNKINDTKSAKFFRLRQGNASGWSRLPFIRLINRLIQVTIVK
jgi:hypothetical protein